MAPPQKKRKVESKVEEVVFDISARHEYLTGFHKRKVQRAKIAQEKATERERQERIAERKKLRDDRKAEVEKHVQEVNKLLEPQHQSPEDTDGTMSEGDQPDVSQGMALEDVDHRSEYIDEDKYTTVTVEAIDVTRDGLRSTMEDGQHEVSKKLMSSELETDSPSMGDRFRKRQWTKDKPSEKKKRLKKKRNFRYEGRTERKVTRAKEKLKNHKQASARRAG